MGTYEKYRAQASAAGDLVMTRSEWERNGKPDYKTSVKMSRDFMAKQDDRWYKKFMDHGAPDFPNRNVGKHKVFAAAYGN